jgi:hypothetical protein
MGKTADQITSEIDHAREQLEANLHELESRVKSATDWRAQFKKHPGAMVAGALIGGVLLSAMLGRPDR